MNEIRTLAIDIGGTGIKAALLDGAGRMISMRQRVPTPAKPVARAALVDAIDKVVTPLGDFDRVSVGFPGYVRNGKVLTAPNLGSEALAGFDLQAALSEHWGKPVRVLNDADVQGFGAIKGHGIELVLTLGTGAGTAIFRDGEIMPHLELAHHPISGNKTYDEYIGNLARKKQGRKAWNKRVAKVIDVLRVVTQFDHLYIGGGNAEDLKFKLPSDVTIVENSDGLTGGIGLWRKASAIPAPGETAVDRPADPGDAAPGPSAPGLSAPGSDGAGSAATDDNAPSAETAG